MLNLDFGKYKPNSDETIHVHNKIIEHLSSLYTNLSNEELDILLTLQYENIIETTKKSDDYILPYVGRLRIKQQRKIREKHLKEYCDKTNIDFKSLNDNQQKKVMIESNKQSNKIVADILKNRHIVRLKEILTKKNVK